MSFRITLTAATVAISLAAGSGMAFAADQGKGKGAGQDIAPGQATSPGKGTAPGQTGTKPAHPDSFGATASDCAKIMDPQKKDDCVRDAKNN